jgi:hypothetical protein
MKSSLLPYFSGGNDCRGYDSWYRSGQVDDYDFHHYCYGGTWSGYDTLRMGRHKFHYRPGQHRQKSAGKGPRHLFPGFRRLLREYRC